MGNKKKPVIKSVIQPCGCDLFLPLALVYMFYIILHGHISPGGGFQGGVLMVAIVIFIYIGHGYTVARKALSLEFMHHAEGWMSIIYVALAMLGIVFGARFCQNVFFANGGIGELMSSGTVAWMNWTVGLKVLTGVGVLALSMLGLVSAMDTDTKE